VNSIRPIEPTLEDVFVALVGHKAGNPHEHPRIKALTKKEFIQMSRDIRSLMGAIFNPLLMIFLFGYALSLDVTASPPWSWILIGLRCLESSSTGSRIPAISP